MKVGRINHSSTLARLYVAVRIQLRSVFSLFRQSNVDSPFSTRAQTMFRLKF